MIRNKITCPDCGIEISTSNFTKHQNSKTCLRNQKEEKREKGICPHCQLNTSNLNQSAKANHVRWCDKNPKREEYKQHLDRLHDLGIGRDAWNKDSTKETDERILKKSNTTKERYANGTIVVSEESRKKNQIKRLNEIKNQTSFSKRTFKKGIYNNNVYDSSWELAFQIYNDDHNIPMFRNKTETLTYTFNGFNHKTIPDFVDADGKFIEIKGQAVTAKDIAKREQTEHLVTYLFYSDIKHILDYVTTKYGKNFTTIFYE